MVKVIVTVENSPIITRRFTDPKLALDFMLMWLEDKRVEMIKWVRL